MSVAETVRVVFGIGVVLMVAVVATAASGSGKTDSASWCGVVGR